MTVARFSEVGELYTIRVEESVLRYIYYWWEMVGCTRCLGI